MGTKLNLKEIDEEINKETIKKLKNREKIVLMPKQNGNESKNNKNT